MEINKIVSMVIDKIKELPEGTETSISCIISKIFMDNKLSTNDLFKINRDVINKVELENIVLDYSKYNNQEVGLPFNIPFIKKLKK